jgi:hypothetical protein
MILENAPIASQKKSHKSDEFETINFEIENKF